MDRQFELETLRRSIALLSPGTRALSREEALALLEELAEVEGTLRSLRAGLRRLVDESSAR